MAENIILYNVFLILYFLSLILILDLAIYFRVLIFERFHIGEFLADRSGKSFTGNSWIEFKNFAWVVWNICNIIVLVALCWAAIYFSIAASIDPGFIMTIFILVQIIAFLIATLTDHKDVGTFGSTPILLKLNATGVMIKIQWQKGSRIKKPYEALWQILGKLFLILPITIVIEIIVLIFSKS